MGEVLFAGEEAQAQKTQKRRALLGVWSPVVLKRNAHHGITGHIFLLTARVRYRALRDRPGFQNNDFEPHLAADVRQGSEMEGGMTRIMVRTHLTKALRNDSSPRLKLAVI